MLRRTLIGCWTVGLQSLPAIADAGDREFGLGLIVGEPTGVGVRCFFQ
jgi:hypothetical protein